MIVYVEDGKCITKIRTRIGKQCIMKQENFIRNEEKIIGYVIRNIVPNIWH